MNRAFSECYYFYILTRGKLSYLQNQSVYFFLKHPVFSEKEKFLFWTLTWMSLGKVWIGHKLSRRMPLVNWQRLQEIGFYLSTLCEFCFRFGFSFLVRFSFRFLFISYATCKLTAAMCFAVQNQQLIAAVWCTPYVLLLYSLYCISNSFWNILKCSLPCVQIYLFFLQKYHLASSGILFSQMLTEHKNPAAVVVVTAAAGALQTEARICKILLTSSCFEWGPW